MSRRQGLIALGLGLILGGLAGCGVTTQDTAQPLPSGAIPVIEPTPSPSPSARESTVYFVSGRGLEPVSEAINDRTAQGVLAALAAGPPMERQADLRTLINDPLDGTPMLVVTSVSESGQVVLARTEAFTLLPANDQVLLVGQVVSSLDDIGLVSVVITDPEGVPIPLALPDGRVLEGPATAADYAALVAVPLASTSPDGGQQADKES